MRLNDDLVVLPVPIARNGQSTIFNLSLILDATHGPTLVDTVRVLFTPGHTPGHIALYFERSCTLIAGDALRASDGQLLGPNPAFTQTWPGRQNQCVRSVQFESLGSRSRA